jgi:hypothetical protein
VKDLLLRWFEQMMPVEKKTPTPEPVKRRFWQRES